MFSRNPRRRAVQKDQNFRFLKAYFRSPNSKDSNFWTWRSPSPCGQMRKWSNSEVGQSIWGNNNNIIEIFSVLYQSFETHILCVFSNILMCEHWLELILTYALVVGAQRQTKSKISLIRVRLNYHFFGRLEPKSSKLFKCSHGGSSFAAPSLRQCGAKRANRRGEFRHFWS